MSISLDSLFSVWSGKIFNRSSSNFRLLEAILLLIESFPVPALSGRPSIKRRGAYLIFPAYKERRLF